MPKEKLIERNCKYHGVTTFILEGRGYYRCRQCRCDGVTKTRKQNKQKLVEAFGGKCELCGYDKCIDALQFHHLDRTTKEFGIAQKGRSWAYSKLLKEAGKCRLVCANCHAELEAGM